MTKATSHRLGIFALAATLAFAVSCADSSRSNPGDPLEWARLAEGTRIAGTVSQSVSMRTAAGAPFDKTFPAMTFASAVTDGVAKVDVKGEEAEQSVFFDVAVAAENRRIDRRTALFTDAEGRRHELMMLGAQGEGPIAKVQHFRDDTLLVEADYDWSRMDGGWVLKARTLSLYGSAPGPLVHKTTIEASQLAGRSRVHMLADGFASAVRRSLRPAPLHAAQVKECLGEWALYAVATTAVVLAEAWVVTQPWNRKAWLALFAAIGAWERALDSLSDCMLEAIVDKQP